ncbi:MAG: hypothetical protein PHV36_03695 [Elusimicrobiales bacterium]|nr:hypothetical protein [Elusimicrobiales bacterium]
MSLNRFKNIFGELAAPAAGLAFSSILLPFGLWLLVVAAGAFHSDSPTEAYDRLFALNLGMLFSGFGIWTAPLGLPVVFKLLGVPEKISRGITRVLTTPWVLSPGLPCLALYAWRSLRPGLTGPYNSDNTLFPAAFLILLALGRFAIEIAFTLKRRNFGKIDFAPGADKCGPGEEASGILALGKKAGSVQGELKLYSDGDEPLATIAARVGPATQTADGWTYRVAAVIPESPAVVGAGGWVLSVKAKGLTGGTIEESFDVEPRREPRREDRT